MSLFGLIYSQAAAQINLVPNPSFEEYDSCPNYISEFFVQKWVSANGATPDYFNSCSAGEVNVPLNIFGLQNAARGNGYVGFFSNDSGKTSLNYREYVQCKLLRPLTAKKKYFVRFYVSLAESTGQACDQIGAFFSKDQISSTWVEEFNFVPQVVSSKGKIISQRNEWVEIKGDFIANGDEEYLTIGVFQSREIINTIGVESLSDGQPYYYLDDVCVYEGLCNSIVLPTAFSPNNDNVNDFYYPLLSDESINLKNFAIYNRWGEIVHNSPLSPWNGEFRNIPQAQDTYTYFIYADLPLPDILTETISCKQVGTFVLVR
jgi:gliding motility-associated-like protein